MGRRKRLGTLVILICTLLPGCSTFRTTTLASMAGGFTGGALLGAAAKPEGDREDMHGLLWGSVTAAIVGATLVYLHDENKIIDEKDRKIKILEIENTERRLGQEISTGTSSFFQDEVPSEVSRLVQPGKWTLYESDKWKRASKNRFIHQDKILEFNPPKIGESR